MCVQVHMPVGRLEEDEECPAPSVSTSLPWDGLSHWTQGLPIQLNWQPASSSKPPPPTSAMLGLQVLSRPQFYMSAKDSNSSLFRRHTLPTEPSSLHQAYVTFTSYQVLITFHWEMSKCEAEVDLLFLSKMQENCPGVWRRIFSNIYTYIFCLIRNLVTVGL